MFFIDNLAEIQKFYQKMKKNGHYCKNKTENDLECRIWRKLSIIQKWTEGHFPCIFGRGIRFWSQFWAQMPLRWLKLAFFCFFGDFRCFFWPKNATFSHLTDIWAQNWLQIRIPCPKLHEKWVWYHCFIIDIFCQIQDFPSKMAIFSRFL